MFYQHVDKNPPLVLTLSQMYPAHMFPPYFSKIHSNIILPSMPRSSEWFLAFRLSNENISCLSHFSCAYYVFHSSHTT